VIGGEFDVVRSLAWCDRQGAAPDPHYLTHSGGPLD